MRVSIDSSLLVALYVMDSRSPDAVQLMSTRPEVWLTPLNCSELAHAIHRHVSRHKLSVFEAHRAWKTFEDDCALGAWELAAFPDRAWATSIDLARRHGPALGLRTLDSLHVACALELKTDKFWTFDERQKRLAEAAGLNTQA